MADKRVRSQNFCFNDKKLLLDTIESRKYIVENKKTDSQSLKAKDIAWVLITNHYNTMASIQRKPENLRMCWENMKRRYRTSIANTSSDVTKLINDCDKFLNKKIADILASTSTQDKYQSLNESNALNSESIEVDNRDLDDNESCSSEDSLNFETKLKEYSEKWSKLKAMKDNEKVESMEGIESMEKEINDKSKTDAPHVLMLTSHDLVSDSETLNENITKTLEFPHEILRNGINLNTNDQLKGDRNTSKKQYQKLKNMNYALAEAKLELAKLSKEHAIAEERRKAELHELQVQEAKLKIELLKLQLLKKEAQMVWVNEE